MNLRVVKNYDEMSKIGAEIFANEINQKNKINICFATGSTPVGMYSELIKMYQKNEVSFKNVTSFNLDEYVGLDVTNKCSYHYFMDQNLFNYIDINRANINFPDGNGDLVKNASDYEKTIKEKGGIDLMVLGIGVNAHIAFNEPGSQINDRTREVELTASTINSNKIYFDNENDVPKTAISMGIGTILEAKKIILLASGISKAQAILDTIKGPITPDVPASFLQTHPDVTLIIDEAAASKL